MPLSPLCSLFGLLTWKKHAALVKSRSPCMLTRTRELNEAGNKHRTAHLPPFEFLFTLHKRVLKVAGQSYYLSPVHSPSCFPRWLFCTFHSLLKYLMGPPLFSVSFYWGSRGDQMRSSTRSHTHTHHLLASVSSNSAFLPVTEWVSPLPGKANPFPRVLDPICSHLLKNITLEISSLSPTATIPVPNASHQLTNI